MKKLLSIFILLLLMSSCEAPNGAGSVTPTEQADSTQNYDVKFLFEVDGIRVYRFYDRRTVYFTSTTGNINYEYTTGSKGRRNHHQVETICNDK